MIATTVLGTVTEANGFYLVKPADGGINVGWGFSEAPFAGPAIVGFGALRGSPDCVTKATLRITTLADAQLSVPVAAYPTASRLVTMPDGQRVRGRVELLDNRPRGVFTFHGTTGTAEIADLLHAYLGARRFVSGKVVDPSANLTISMQPESPTSIESFTMATGDSAPTLALERRC